MNPQVRTAANAGLRYVSDTAPGILRRRVGGGFHYQNRAGRAIRDVKTLTRIRSLVIPPAWTDVWICAHPLGHLQATGRDAKGRKQFRYHPRWREVRDESKFDRLLAFAGSLPKLRKRVRHDLARKGLPRERVLAAVVRLLESSLVRVGNPEYARANGSFGLTTLLDHHIRISGSTMRFAFDGKSRIRHVVDVTDRRLATILHRCRDLPGRELFQYVDEAGRRRRVASQDINRYIRETTGEDFTSKDFRTWAGTLHTAKALGQFGSFGSRAEANRNIVAAIKSAAQRLGNTAAVCRKCYVHPAILEAYLDGHWIAASGGSQKSLRREETALTALLKRQLKKSP
jgi:DNA topoisomerase-1